MKKMILMGGIGGGKTSLVQALRGEKLDYDKTQAVEFIDNMIDTPGEYIRHRKFIQSLTVTAAESDVVGLVQSAIEPEQIFSQGFGALFPKTIIGIISKMDLVEDDEDVQLVEDQLYSAGAEKIFKISSQDGTGVAALYEFLSNDD